MAYLKFTSSYKEVQVRLRLYGYRLMDTLAYQIYLTIYINYLYVTYTHCKTWLIVGKS